MFKFIKKVLANLQNLQTTEIKSETVNLTELDSWFRQKISKLSHSQFFQTYFQRIESLQAELQEKISELETAEIAKEHKTVQERVKNIVLGHREKYCREITQFLEKMEALSSTLQSNQSNQFNTIEDYQNILNFNQNLDHEIEELAKRTAKSYSASQHLFFKETEAIFKLIGELNLLVRNFKVKEPELEALLHLYEYLQILNSERQKNNLLEQQLDENRSLQSKQQQELEETEKFLKLLETSEKYKKYLRLKEEEQTILEKITKEGDFLFEFFSKLNKPLRKYSHSILDHSIKNDSAKENRLVQQYLDNYVLAFKEDDNLKIKEILQDLKNHLPALKLDEKTEKNTLELIQKSTDQFLEKIKKNIVSLEEEHLVLAKVIAENNSPREKEKLEEERRKIQSKIIQHNHFIEELKNKLNQNQQEGIIQSIKGLVRNSLEIEIEIKND